MVQIELTSSINNLPTIICSPIYLLLTNQSINLSIYQPTYLSVYVYLSIYLSIYLSLQYGSINQSIYLSMSTYLPTYLGLGLITYECIIITYIIIMYVLHNNDPPSWICLKYKTADMISSFKWPYITRDINSLIVATSQPSSIEQVNSILSQLIDLLYTHSHYFCGSSVETAWRSHGLATPPKPHTYNYWFKRQYCYMGNSSKDKIVIWGTVQKTI